MYGHIAGLPVMVTIEGLIRRLCTIGLNRADASDCTPFGDWGKMHWNADERRFTLMKLMSEKVSAAAAL
jgi:hypothetical protein